MNDLPRCGRVILAVSFLAIGAFVSGCSTHQQQSAKASASAHAVRSASVRKAVKTAKAEPAKMPAASKPADAILTASIAPEAAPIAGKTWNYEYGGYPLNPLTSAMETALSPHAAVKTTWR